MTAKEYLSQVYWLRQKIKDNEAEREAILSQAQSLRATDYSKDVVISSPKPYASYEDAVIKSMKYDEEIAADTARKVELEKRIRAEIEAVEDETERSILRKRYILFYDWNRIADEMCYSYRHVTRLHGRALQSFSKLYGFPKDIL